MPFPGESLELARLRALGQAPPDIDPETGQPIHYESPDSYVDPAEQGLTLPRGLSAPSHEGGFQGVALASRIRDATSETPPPPPAAPRPSAEEAKSDQGTVGPAAIAGSGSPQVSWTNSDPAAVAKAERSQKDLAAETGLIKNTAGAVKKLIGGAGILEVLGGGPAGTTAGAASDAGFGQDASLSRLAAGGGSQNSTSRLLAALLGMA